MYSRKHIILTLRLIVLVSLVVSGLYQQQERDLPWHFWFIIGLFAPVFFAYFSLSRLIIFVKSSPFFQVSRILKTTTNWHIEVFKADGNYHKLEVAQ